MYSQIHALIDRTIDRAAHQDTRWRHDTVIISMRDEIEARKLLTNLGFQTKRAFGDYEPTNSLEVHIDTLYINYQGDK